MNRYRTVFISDTHLGTKMSKSRFLLDFLKSFECDTIYLVGDIIDGTMEVIMWNELRESMDV